MEDVQELKTRLAKLNTANRPFYEQCQLVCSPSPIPYTKRIPNVRNIFVTLKMQF